ncbi:nuclear transport factor 2 family protein [Frankia gtarii]|uniref:nuclear transport factor 2 family protein n=1 Tax=Frankia gtarii TaxID=2950102 RepID=UPI0021C198FC|nr:nuclear transport factor 2 family protein [Frankia gtarii]
MPDLPDDRGLAEIGWRAGTVLHRYCRAIDQGDAGALREVFAADAALVVAAAAAAAVEGGPGSEQVFSGRDTVVGILASLFDQRQWARHLVSNLFVDVEPDGSVDVRSYFQYWLGRADGTAHGVGDYHVTMRESDGRLAITTLAATILEEITLPAAVPAASTAGATAV